MTRCGLFSALLLACTGCSGQQDPAPTPAALVKLAPAASGQLAQEVTLYGLAEVGASSTLTVMAPIEARVVRIVAPVGTKVSAGQIVAVLAPGPTVRVELAKAWADARAANSAYARAARLRTDGLVSNAEVETARAAAADANAVASNLRSRLGALDLRAPGAGFVDSVNAKPGDLVQTGAIVASITRNTDLRARFGADPTTARSLRPGSPMHVTSGGAGAGFIVPIGSVSPIVDPTTRLAAVYAALPLAAGIAVGEPLTGTVTVSGSSYGGVTIPYAALLDEGGQPYVFVVQRGQAHRRDVTVGPAQGDRVSILKGVKAGELVVVEGGTAVEDGMKVRTK